MKILLKTIGALLALVGIVWILQGVDVLPGSFMTGRIEWAIYGTLALVAGLGLLWDARRR